MFVISNEPLNYSVLEANEKIDKMTYDEFYRQVTSDQGLDIADGTVLFMNINDIGENVYPELVDNDTANFFTLDGTKPEWATEEVNDWSAAAINVPTSEPAKLQDNELPPVPHMIQSRSEINGDMSKKIMSSLDGDDGFGNIKESTEKSLDSLLDASSITSDDDYNDSIDDTPGQKTAFVEAIGSSKGGTGKTFTTIMTAYRYAKTHQNLRIAVLDFDILDGQIGISIHKISPTMRNYYIQYQKGNTDFDTLHRFAVKGNAVFPQNVDFYLAPNSAYSIKDDEFWLNILDNVIHNYDVVFIDCGIDYLNLEPISYAYKLADKVVIVTTTSIKSVDSISKQINRLKGEVENPTFTEEDNMGGKLNIVITQMIPKNEMNNIIYKRLNKRAPVIATFGIIQDAVMSAEYYGEWDVFDNNKGVRDSFDRIAP
jgi:cellulose biosynthesis protein BcsQ